MHWELVLGRIQRLLRPMWTCNKASIRRHIQTSWLSMHKHSPGDAEKSWKERGGWTQKKYPYLRTSAGVSIVKTPECYREAIYYNFGNCEIKVMPICLLLSLKTRKINISENISVKATLKPNSILWNTIAFNRVFIHTIYNFFIRLTEYPSFTKQLLSSLQREFH